MLKHATWMAAKQQKGQANHPPVTTRIASPTTSHASSTPRKQPCQSKSQSRSASASVPSMQCNAMQRAFKPCSKLRAGGSGTSPPALPLHLLARQAYTGRHTEIEHPISHPVSCNQQPATAYNPSKRSDQSRTDAGAAAATCQRHLYMNFARWKRKGSAKKHN